VNDDEPFLLTERLALWKPRASDRAELFAMVAPPEVRRFLGDRPTSEADEFARLIRNAGSWMLYGYGTFICRDRADGRLVALCGLFHSWRGFAKGLDDAIEAGWIVAQEDWGKGIAGEAMRAAIDWFDAAIGPRRIACMIEEGNAASLALAARLGFTRYAVEDIGEERPLILLERLPEGAAS